MVLKFRRMLLLPGLLAAFAFMCGCEDSADRHVETEPVHTVSGNVAQVYVRGAMIIADKTGLDGLGNFDMDAGEIHTFSGNAGDFTFELPESYGSYVLFSKGGTITDSQGNPIPAFSMLAHEGARHITPVTTVVALAPILEVKIGPEYDADIAGPAGANGTVMQLAKTVEAVMAVFTEKNQPMVVEIADQIAILKKLAVAFADPGVDLANDVDIVAAVENAVVSVFADHDILDKETRADETGITNAIVACVTGIAGLIDETSDAVLEDAELLGATEAQVGLAVQKLLNTVMLAFDPTASVIPFPNDVTWASVPAPRTGLVTIDPATAQDDASAALYTAINALELKGFSPNAMVGIPLTKATQLDADSLQRNIRLVNLNTLVGTLHVALGLGANPLDATPESVIGGLSQLDAAGWAGIQATLNAQPYSDMIYEADIEVIQDGNYIKVFPLKPLDPGTAYLMVVLDDIDDVNGFSLKQPTYYQFLKSDEPLTGSLAVLEELRGNYAPIYNYYLKSLGMEKGDTLEIFTFTTAAKTLSIADFMAIGAYLAGSIDLAGMTGAITGLDYTDVASEYGTFDAATDLMLSLMDAGTLPFPFVNPDDTFTSFDITTLQATPPTSVGVPYLILNGDQYSDTVVIFQHGYGRMKTDTMGLAGIPLPLIGMDLPLHGDRTIEGAESGTGYLSADIATDRLNIYQSVFDMSMMLKNLKAGRFDIDGDGETDTPEKVYFVGQSMGAVTGSIFAAHNTASPASSAKTNLLDKIVLNVGGANFSVIIDGATNEEISAISAGFNLTRNTTEYFVTLGMMQTLFDPADPAYLANSDDVWDVSLADKTIVQTAHNDTLVPNVPNEMLANIVGYSESVQITDFAGTVSSEPGWYHFGGELGKPDNWIKHGFLLDASVEGYPEIPEGSLNPDDLQAAQDAAHDQIIRFFEE